MDHRWEDSDYFWESPSGKALLSKLLDDRTSGMPWSLLSKSRIHSSTNKHGKTDYHTVTGLCSSAPTSLNALMDFLEILPCKYFIFNRLFACDPLCIWRLVSGVLSALTTNDLRRSTILLSSQPYQPTWTTIFGKLRLMGSRTYHVLRSHLPRRPDGPPRVSPW